MSRFFSGVVRIGMFFAFISTVLCLQTGLRAGEPENAGGTVANPFVYIGGYDKTITCFAFDTSSGTLKPMSTSDGGQAPSYLAWHPSRKFMYAINEAGKGKVIAFSINPNDGAITKLNEASAAGNGPCHLAVSPNGKWVITANYGSGHVGVLPIKPDGSVGEPVCTVKAGENAHMAVIDRSGKYVFIPCLGSNYVAQYILDDASGELKPNTVPTVATAAGAGPRHLAFHPNGKFAYLINEKDNTVDKFNYDAASGTLSSPEPISTLPAGADPKGNSTAHIVVLPSGKFVYGSNRGNNTIVIYSVNPEDGKLTLVGHENGGEIKIPRDFAVDLTGKYLIVASQASAIITVFRIDPDKGTLTKLNTTNVPKGPAYVGVMPVP